MITSKKNCKKKTVSKGQAYIGNKMEKLQKETSRW